MAYDHAKRRAARRAYVEDGSTFPAIATALNVNARTLQRWRDDAAEHGDDWPVARKTKLHALKPTALETAISGLLSIQQEIAAAIRDDVSTDTAEKLKRIGELASSFTKIQSASLIMANLILVHRAAELSRGDNARIGKT